MAVDILTESARLDSVLLCTGDGDFFQVVRAIQSQGCRVELLAFQNVSHLLRDSVDEYLNGYMVPDLAYNRDHGEIRPEWGQVGSKVRGYCRQFDPIQGFGFLSYWPAMPDAKIASTELTTAYFRSSQLADRAVASRLPSRSHIFEFELAQPSKPDGKLEAKNIFLVAES